MSDYTVISAVSQTLKSMLDASFAQSSDTQINTVLSDLHSPKELQQSGDATVVSVWLYKVSRMAEMLNEPPVRRAANQMKPAPLPVLLYYLVTPMTTDPLKRHALLGKVLQVFHDQAILRGSALQGVLAGTDHQIRVNLEALTLEELSLVWYALGEPYQLSVTYLIQVAEIDSALEPFRVSPVLQRDMQYKQVMSSSSSL